MRFVVRQAMYGRSSLVFLIALTACGTLDHVVPQPRTWDTEAETTVKLMTTCAESAPFKNGEPDDPHQLDPDVHWMPDARLSGVIVSEAHVITAAHGVNCPVLPSIVVYLSDGREFPAIVERDDLMFGPGDDVARVRLRGAYDRFEIRVAPPKIAPVRVGDVVCARFFHDEPRCGEVLSLSPYAWIDVEVHPGDSGTPVYDLGGDLVGIVVATDGSNHGRVELAQTDWLAST